MLRDLETNLYDVSRQERKR